MATTVAAGSSATFEVGPYDTITLTDANAIGTLVLTSQTPKIVSDQTLAVQNGTFGPWRAPMSVVLTVTQGSADYTVNVKSLTVTQAGSAKSLVTGDGWTTNQQTVLSAGGGIVVADSSGNLTGPAGAIAAGGSNRADITYPAAWTSDFSSLTGWVQSGAASWTVSSGNLNVPSGTLNTDILEYRSKVISAHRARLTVEFSLPNPLTSLACGFGFRDVKSVGTKRALRVFLGSGSSPLVISVFDQSAQVGTVTSSLVIAAGNRMRVVMERHRDLVMIHVTNVTTGGQAGFDYAYPTGTAGAIMGGAAYPTVYANTTAITVHSVSAQELEPASADFAVVGDSITAGYSLAAWGSLIWAQRIAFEYGLRIALYGGPGDTTAEGVAAIAGILAATPRRVLVFLGTNDLAGSVALGTIQSNLNSIKSSCDAAGIQVDFVAPLPRTSVTTSTLRAWMVSNLNAINPSAMFDDGAGSARTSLLPDGTHPVEAGHRLLAQDIAARLPILA